MKKTLKKFWAEEEGQTTTEYILIVAVVVLIAMKMKEQLSGTLEKILNTTAGKANTVLDDFN